MWVDNIVKFIINIRNNEMIKEKHCVMKIEYYEKYCVIVKKYLYYNILLLKENKITFKYDKYCFKMILKS